jgi:heme/copper-type cytochrome/quinol oxidase subunit 2
MFFCSKRCVRVCVFWKKKKHKHTTMRAHVHLQVKPFATSFETHQYHLYKIFMMFFMFVFVVVIVVAFLFVCFCV